MDYVSFSIILAITLAIPVWAVVYSKLRTDKIIDNWAKQSGYRVISAKRRWIDIGPHRRSLGYQTVMRVEVEDGQGRRRKGYLWCGSRMGGIFTDKTTIYWDDEETGARG